MRCGVIGAGAWGTALADLLSRNGHEVSLWAREPDVVESIGAKRENERFLAGFPLDARLRATGRLEEAAADAELLLLVPPSHALRSVTRQLAAAGSRDGIGVVASKGIEADSLALMTDVVESEMPASKVVALSGPSFAAEVAARQPTAVVVAARRTDDAQIAQQAFSSEAFRAYTSDDLVGVELGGALKNVMAVATGMAEGAGLGFNSRAALITRGLAEMTRLGMALGASPSTFAGLAGLGDLVLTCTGTLSRNRALGAEIGKGATLEQALAGRETVAEGVHTARSARDLARREGVEMPIVDAVCRILFEGFAARSAIGELMQRELRAERDR
jgi:glycerol-3-phosphate dehydrogenase (NAD(P)+)